MRAVSEHMNTRKSGHKRRAGALTKFPDFLLVLSRIQGSAVYFECISYSFVHTCRLLLWSKANAEDSPMRSVMSLICKATPRTGVTRGAGRSLTYSMH